MHMSVCFEKTFQLSDCQSGHLACQFVLTLLQLHFKVTGQSSWSQEEQWSVLLCVRAFGCLMSPEGEPLGILEQEFLHIRCQFVTQVSAASKR